MKALMWAWQQPLGAGGRVEMTILTYKLGNWDSEWLSNLPKVTQLGVQNKSSTKVFLIWRPTILKQVQYSNSLLRASIQGLALFLHINNSIYFCTQRNLFTVKQIYLFKGLSVFFFFVFPNKPYNKRKADILDDKWEVGQAALWFQRSLFIRACHWEDLICVVNSVTNVPAWGSGHCSLGTGNSWSWGI